MSKFLAVLKVVSLWAACFIFFINTANSVQAQTGGDIFDVDENYRPDLDAELSTGLASFDAGVVGDTIDMSNGSLTFRHTDVSLPGNSDLPVSFGRFYTYKGVDYHGNQVGGWNMDIPFLQESSRFGLQHEVHPLFEASGLSADDLFSQDITSTTCSSNLISSNTHPNEGLGGVDSATGLPNTGLRLFMPGQGGELLTDTRRLSTAEVNNVFGSTSPSKVTASNMVARCNDSETGLEVVSPNGWSYSFGYSVTHIAQRVRVSDDYFSRLTGNEIGSSPCNSGPLEGGEDISAGPGCPTESPLVSDYNDYFMLVVNKLTLPTEIRDASGNWVRYEYDGRRLTRIHANDGREITIEYEGIDYSGVSALYARKRVKRVTANGRDWIYNYSVNNNTGVSMLESVTQPDEREWLYDVPRQPSFQIGAGNVCGFDPNVESNDDVNISVTHPAGTRADFVIDRIEQGYTKVPNIRRRLAAGAGHLGGESLGDFEACQTHYESSSSLSFAVKTKTLTISDLTQNSETVEVWNYDYEQDQGERIDEDSFSPPSGPTSAADLRKTTVTNPEGEKTEYYYDRRFDSPTIGSLMKQKTYNAGELSPLSETEFSYDIISQYGSSGLPGSCIPTQETNCTSYNDYAVQYNNPYQVPLLNQKLNKITTVSRDGDIYTTENTYNTDFGSVDYSYGFPISDRTYSSQSYSSAPRGRDIEYVHDTSKWILGLPARLTEVSSSGATREAATYTHNANGLLTNKTRYGQPWVSLTYNSSGIEAGTVAMVTDALGRTTEALNWHRGKPQQIIRPDGVPQSQTVNSDGWVTSRTDANQNTTSYNHDDMGRLTQITPPSGWDSTTIDYDFSSGGAIQTITKGQAKTTVTYDSMFRSTLEQTQALDTGWSSFVNTTYDGLGRVIFQSQPSTNPNETKGVETTYDGLGRIYDITENVAPFAKTRHRYSSNHRMRIIDPSGARTETYSYGYGGPGSDDYRVIQKRDASGSILQVTRLYQNEYGQLIRLRQYGNHDGQSVNKSQYFKYDSNQRLCRHYVPEHGASVYRYDAAGQMTGYIKGLSTSGCGFNNNNNARVAQSYDALGRPTVTDFRNANTPDITKTYDANGNVLTVNRGSGSSAVNWTYAYNNADMLTSEKLDIDGRNYDSAYLYNSSGYMTQKTQPGNRVINYTPDGLGRINMVKNGSQTLASGTSFHANGSLHQMQYGNGQYFSHILNARLQTERLLSYKGANKAIDQTFGYDARGLVISIIDGAVNDNNRSYGYDGLGYLKTASGPWGAGSYKYDSLGNLREKKLGARTVNVAYDNRNRASRSVDSGASGTRTMAYDARGNVTTLGNLTFAYDMSDQPIAVSGTANGIGSANGTYRYDGNMKRVKSIMNDGSSTKVIYNIYTADGSLVQIDKATENKITDYVSGPMGTLARISSTLNPQNGTYGADDITYLHPDHLGSAQAGTKANGAVAWREQYTPFGEEIQSVAANDNLGGFTGHIKDKATGLNYMQARYYDPVIGRFLSIDPVDFMTSGYNPAYFNRYAYSGNDPINNIDPDGQFFGAAGKLIKLAVKGGDIGATFAGAAQDVGTIFDGDASGVARLGAVASLTTEVFSPVSARDAKAGAGFVQKKLGGTCCFVAGTLVETEFGLRPIEEIELGDRVLARNPETGETALKSVTDLIRLNERQIWEVSLSGNNGASEFFETTDDHPWWVVDEAGQGSWKDTAELLAGMIVTTADNQTMIITKVLETDRIDATYNLTVANFETYFVGENKVLVHNCGKQQGLLQDQSPELRDALQGKARAPESSVPFDTKTRLNDDGSIKQVTTYDGTGRRKTQFDLNDGRHSEHRHDFEGFGPGSPNGQRTKEHRPLDDIRE